MSNLLNDLAEAYQDWQIASEKHNALLAICTNIIKALSDPTIGMENKFNHDGKVGKYYDHTDFSEERPIGTIHSKHLLKYHQSIPMSSWPTSHMLIKSRKEIAKAAIKFRSIFGRLNDIEKKLLGNIDKYNVPNHNDSWNQTTETTKEGVYIAVRIDTKSLLDIEDLGSLIGKEIVQIVLSEPKNDHGPKYPSATVYYTNGLNYIEINTGKEVVWLVCGKCNQSANGNLKIWVAMVDNPIIH